METAMAPAVKNFQPFTSDQRADMRASHRLGFRQRESVGQAFWTHALVPDIAFPTRKAALLAASRAWASRAPRVVRAA